MRSFRFVTVAVIFMLSLAAPNVFARICHPRKPITCSASTLTAPAPAVKAHTAKAQSMICGPWIRTFPYCAAGTLASAATAKPAAKPAKQQAMICGPWIRTFPYCAAKTLEQTPRPAAKPQVIDIAKEQQMICGPWIRTFPYCAAKTIG